MVEKSNAELVQSVVDAIKSSEGTTFITVSNDRTEVYRMLKAANLVWAVDGFLEELRRHIKYGTDESVKEYFGSDTVAVLEKVRETIYKFIEDEGINFEEMKGC